MTMSVAKKTLAAFAFIALTAFTPNAHAQVQTIPMSPELKAFLMRPDEQSAVTAIMRHQWDEVMPGCEGAIKATNVIITQVPLFDNMGYPKTGSWRVTSRIEGCSQSRLFTVLYLFDKDGKLQKAGLLPGDTHADMVLQHDGLMQAYAAMAKIAPANCKDVKFLDTKFLGVGDKIANIPDGRVDHVWSEDWTLKACGVTGVVNMTFTPDATGTTITAPVDKTRKISG